MSHSSHGTAKNEQGQEQGQDRPTDKARVQPAPSTHPDRSATREATRDPKLNDAEKTPGSGMIPDDGGDAPTG